MKYYIFGIGFLALAKLRHLMMGYSTPKPFGHAELDRCIDYDIKIVNTFLDRHPDIAGKHILELGPGSDLGVGLYLLHKGAAKYSACDVNNLDQRTPAAFYDRLFDRIGAEPWLREEFAKFKAGISDRLNYSVTERFDLAAAGKGTVDIVFSQSAFEHFDDIDDTVRQVTEACKPGAAVVAEVDLKTHSRWIRQKDPLNIYRYPEWLYRLFYFRGQPNRVRPSQYREIFQRHGWSNVAVTPVSRTDYSKVPPVLRTDHDGDFGTILVQGTLH